MKRLTLTILFLLLAVPCFAQDSCGDYRQMSYPTPAVCHDQYAMLQGVVGSGGVATPCTLMETHTTGGTHSGWALSKDDTNDYLHIASRITSSQATTYTIDYITITMDRTSTPVFTYTIWVVNNNDGDPEDNADANSVEYSTKNSGDLGTSYASVAITPKTTSKSITTGQVYWIKITANALGTSTAYMDVDAYRTGGEVVKASANDSTWTTPDADADLVINIYTGSCP